MVEIYEKNFLTDKHIESGIIKLWKEQDCISIMSARYATMCAGVIKKVNGKLTLTKKGISLLKPGNRMQLFHLFFEAFTTKFLWSSNDRYTKEPAGQLGWAFSILLLHKFGEEKRPVNFYAEKYSKAFPEFISFFHSLYTSPSVQYTNSYYTRVFGRFLLWFGFVHVEYVNRILNEEQNKVTRTELVNKCFKFDIE